MKSSLLLFALLFALCTQPLLGEADSSPEQVVDTAGKKVRAGVDYYIRPVPTSPTIICRRLPCVIGSGFALKARSANETCPLDVVVEGGSGQAVTFTPVNPKKGVIRVSTDLNIKTDVKTNCTESTVWRVEYDDSTGQRLVTTGGVIGNPGKDTLSNWFKIEKYENDYKLVFCPTVCNTCKPFCGDVGVFLDSNGNQRVALTDKPYKVRFQPSA